MTDSTKCLIKGIFSNERKRHPWSPICAVGLARHKCTLLWLLVTEEGCCYCDWNFSVPACSHKDSVSFLSRSEAFCFSCTWSIALHCVGLLGKHRGQVCRVQQGWTPSTCTAPVGSKSVSGWHWNLVDWMLVMCLNTLQGNCLSSPCFQASEASLLLDSCHHL